MKGWFEGVVKICTYCRREVDDEIKECPYCGASEFIEKHQGTFKEEIRANIVDKSIKPTSSVSSRREIIESTLDKKASPIYRIIKYILLGIFFYFFILVILAIIVLVYVAVTGNIPSFLSIS
ncbi:MAG: hypothetical protein LUK37_07005 [Clostridia bacterium]|nr:hypothetical protein [Clostridia bacterium]